MMSASAMVVRSMVMRKAMLKPKRLGSVTLACTSADPSLLNLPPAVAVSLVQPRKKCCAVILVESSCRIAMAMLLARADIVTVVALVATYVPVHCACVGAAALGSQLHTGRPTKAPPPVLTMVGATPPFHETKVVL